MTTEQRAALVLAEADELRAALQASGEAGYFARRDGLRALVQQQIRAAVEEYRARVLRAVTASNPWEPTSAYRAVQGVPLEEPGTEESEAP